MDQDFLLKAILMLSISISILILTYFLTRLLISLKKLVDESTKVVEDTSEITDTLASSVRSVKSGFETGGIALSVFRLISSAGIITYLKELLSKKSKKKAKEKSSSDSSEKE
ncbi:hypothetical protein KC678_04265 [Candidatus Dojkabacteria bacterium]|uniref:DUF948 domain-containing protein n=1 Tax=Candidatus Dojkabacteria bacterium TaxID=2099670 RepID=A0A955L258_9BACT|nr:hypothetical protein [Candidatus Dojkabacteria bacterium]